MTWWSEKWSYYLRRHRITTTVLWNGGLRNIIKLSDGDIPVTVWAFEIKSRTYAAFCSLVFVLTFAAFCSSNQLQTDILDFAKWWASLSVNAATSNLGQFLFVLTMMYFGALTFWIWWTGSKRTLFTSFSFIEYQLVPSVQKLRGAQYAHILLYTRN